MTRKKPEIITGCGNSPLHGYLMAAISGIVHGGGVPQMAMLVIYCIVTLYQWQNFQGAEPFNGRDTIVREVYVMWVKTTVNNSWLVNQSSQDYTASTEVSVVFNALFW